MPRPNYLKLMAGANDGDPVSQYRLGIAFYEGRGVAKDQAQAARWISYAARQGHALAQFVMGSLYEYGEGVAQDLEAAFDWYHRAAEQGVALSQVTIASMYSAGRGTREDWSEAVKWLHLAAGQGDAIAQSVLADMICRSDFAAVKDAGSMQEVGRRALAGEVRAQYALGIWYLNNERGQRRYALARQWLQRAAQQGHETARLIAGEITRARRGEARSQFALGKRFLKGGRIASDGIEAARWFLRAAQQDHTEAQFRLALIYRHGSGVRVNNDIALDWFRKVAEKGDRRALMFFEDLRC